MRTTLTELARDLSRLLRGAGFTADGIAAHLGPAITEAMHRGEPGAVRTATGGGTTMDQLIRTFILRDPQERGQVGQLLGPELAQALIDAEVLTPVDQPDGAGAGMRYRVAIDIRPQVIAGVDRLVLSDADAAMTEHVPGPDHVLGVGAASLSLLRATPTTAVDTVLDLGTGSGVQALGQLSCARKITATDVHPRALDFAEATFAAAGADTGGQAAPLAEVELLAGPWFEPVRGRRFDRIIANPPFVVGLPEVGHVYRDSGLDLDGATALVVAQAAAHLAAGGTAHLLGAWVHTEDQSWQQRVASWLPDRGVCAWVAQRDLADPAHYVGTWLRDESLDPRSAAAAERTTAWLEHFAAAGVRGVGFGFIALQEIGDHPSEVLAEEMPQAFTDPLGPEVLEHFARTDWLRRQSVQDLADAQLQVRPGVAREIVEVADTDAGLGFSPAVTRLTRTEGPRWSHQVDSHLSAIIAGLHPQGLNLGETIGLYCMSQGLDVDETLLEAIAAVTDLIRHGLVLPVELLADTGAPTEEEL